MACFTWISCHSLFRVGSITILGSYLSALHLLVLRLVLSFFSYWPWLRISILFNVLSMTLCLHNSTLSSILIWFLGFLCLSFQYLCLKACLVIFNNIYSNMIIVLLKIAFQIINYYLEHIFSHYLKCLGELRWLFDHISAVTFFGCGGMFCDTMPLQKEKF